MPIIKTPSNVQDGDEHIAIAAGDPGATPHTRRGGAALLARVPAALDVWSTGSERLRTRARARAGTNFLLPHMSRRSHGVLYTGAPFNGALYIIVYYIMAHHLMVRYI